MLQELIDVAAILNALRALRIDVTRGQPVSARPVAAVGAHELTH
jgi:hypothetical protein